MEALAPPGTEEECGNEFAASTSSSSSLIMSKKKTAENERLLALRFVQPGGSYAAVFELNVQNGKELWYCNVCKCPVMGQVFNHEAGKRHCNSLESANIHNRVDYGPPKNSSKGSGSGGALKVVDEPIRIAPGEPVPPGFEDEITKVAKIQERLDNFKKSSLIGLEYLLERQDYDQEREPYYLCLLCGKKGDSRTIIPHLISYKHLQCYLQRHYPKTFNALLPFSNHRKYKKCWQDTVTKIADAIEAKYGRLKPHPVDMETYEESKSAVFAMIHNGPHFSEANGETFEHLIDKDEIIRISNENFMDELKATNEVRTQSFNEAFNHNSSAPPSSAATSAGATAAAPTGPGASKAKRPPKSSLRRRSLSSVSSISSDEFDSFDSIPKPQPRPHVVTRPAPDRAYDRNLFNRRRRSRSRSRSRSPYRSRRDSLPWNRPDYIRKDKEKHDDERKPETKREEFRRLANAIETDMERQLRQHQLNPEKHPQYNDEWRIFWNKRYRELQQEGTDTAGYDFKPEWIVYWNKRMEEFHKAEVKVKVDALRRRLGLPEIAPISFKIGTARNRTSSNIKPAPVAAQPDQDHEVIVIDDTERDRSHSPWESDVPSRRKSPVTSRRRRTTRSKSRSRSRTRYSSRRSRSRSSGRRRSRSSSRSRNSYSRHRSRRTRSKSPANKRSTPTNAVSRGPAPGAGRSHDDFWQRNIFMHKNDVVMVRESTLKKQAELDEQLNEVESGDVNIVAVLRLLTALEDKLGSLGPKVVDLLTTALALEKKEPNSAETLLDNDDNCVLFETIKEKLKGLLHAGLVGFGQEKAIKTSITKLATLIHMSNTRKEERSKADALKAIDKAAIAEQIANALILQGKTDVTQAELEQLINTVISMAEVSKSKKSPVTTASFLKMFEKKETVADVEPAAATTTIANKSDVDASREKDKDSMDGLSDLALQTLLLSFKDLPADEQHLLISYLKELEAKEPERVETLRKFVNIDAASVHGTPLKKDLSSVPTSLAETASGRVSPFSMKLLDTSTSKKAATSENKKIELDDDEEDYSFEDVFKAASKNVELSSGSSSTTATKDKSTVENVSNLIANIMVSIASKTSTSSANHQSLPSAPKLNLNTSTSSSSSTATRSLAQTQDSLRQHPSQNVVQYPTTYNSSQFQSNYNYENYNNYYQRNPNADPSQRFYPGGNGPPSHMQHQQPQQSAQQQPMSQMNRMPPFNAGTNPNQTNVNANNGNVRNNYYRW